MIAIKPIIYLDMDGVLADWEQQAYEFFGAEWRTELDKPQWGRFQDYPDYFLTLKPMEGAKELYNACCEVAGCKSQVQLLTALPNRVKFDDAARDKIMWAKRHIDQNIRVVFGPYAQDKQYHYRTNDILIDDMALNIEQWPGFGIQHTSAETSIAILLQQRSA
jgi:5'(3')-deoxyribonucleotidase